MHIVLQGIEGITQSYRRSASHTLSAAAAQPVHLSIHLRSVCLSSTPHAVRPLSIRWCCCSRSFD